MMVRQFFLYLVRVSKPLTRSYHDDPYELGVRFFFEEVNEDGANVVAQHEHGGRVIEEQIGDDR